MIAGRFGGVCVVLFLALPVLAADLTVQVVDGRGQGVADAVVMVLPAGTAATSPRSGPVQTKTIDQKNEQFIPYVEVFRPGDLVVFRNSDKTRHHVYSFSSAKSFEFVLPSGESSRPLQLDQVGVVAVGCNIHDQMITYLYVSDAPWMVKSGEDGRTTIANLPPGDYTVRVWHPQLHPAKPEVEQPLRIGAVALQSTFSLSLLPDPRLQAGHEHGRY